MVHDYSEDPVGRFEENMLAGEALRPSEMQASASRYRQLADGILDHFHEIASAASAGEEEMPEGFDDARRKAERLRGHADRLLALADRVEEAKAMSARLRGLPPEQLDEKEKKELARSLHELYGPLPEAFGPLDG